jgi:hypothetical protein
MRDGPVLGGNAGSYSGAFFPYVPREIPRRIPEAGPGRSEKTMGTLEARLQQVGMKSLSEYLGSGLWEAAQERYVAALLPFDCLGCGSMAAPLRHRSYQRLGAEEPTDLAPLCDRCHARVRQEIERSNGRYHEKDMHALLRKIYGWSKEHMHRVFAPYQRDGRPNGAFLMPRHTDGRGER